MKDIKLFWSFSLLLEWKVNFWVLLPTIYVFPRGSDFTNLEASDVTFAWLRGGATLRRKGGRM